MNKEKAHFGTEVELRHLVAILNHIAEGVFTVDARKRITFFNPAAERMTGFSAEEALGKPCCDIFRSDACGGDCILDEVYSTRRFVTDRRVRIVDINGNELAVRVNAGPLEDADGNLVGGIETFLDLSAEDELRRRVEDGFSFQDIVSRHDGMQALFALLPDIAASEVPVLIEGASGTGKELFARAIHNLSARREGPFVAVNCGALPDTLLESELFGYRKGAFTDARSDRRGRFEAARGGTLFLDEIGDVSQAMQVRLLRVLQERTFEPLGSVEPVRADVRIVAATNRPLADLVAEGEFRQDLYYRVNVMRLELPGLAERGCDIPLLVEHFRRRLNAETGRRIELVDEGAWEALMSHDYPGNIRELENIMQRAFVLCRGDTIMREHLPPELRDSGDAEAPEAEGELTLREIERKAILAALRDTDGNRSAAARRLGIHPSSLYRKMRRYREGTI